MKRPWLALLILPAACSKEETPAAPDHAKDEVWVSKDQVDTQTVAATERDMPRAVVAPGRVTFEDPRLTRVFSPVTGRVIRVRAQPGQRLHKGDPLLDLVSPDVGQASSDVVKARADMAAAEADYLRQKSLLQDDAATRRDYETAEDNYRRAKAELERARQRLSMWGQIDEVSQEFTLRSFIDGKVMARMVNPGVEIQGQYSGGTATELFTIGDITRVWVYADVPETDVPEVALDAECEIRAVAYPTRVFPGKVDWVSGALDPALRTCRVRLQVANEDEALKPEMFATVRIPLASKKHVAVPEDAVVHIGEGVYVYAANGDAPDGRKGFKRRPVVVGRAEAGLVPILRGLRPGERVMSQTPVGRQELKEEASLKPGEIEAAQIKVAPVEEQDLPDVLPFGARLAFDDMRSTHIFSPVNGRVTRLLAKLGQRVEKGAPLVAISSPDVGQFLSDAVKAEADKIAMEHEYERQKKLYQSRAGALRDLEAAEDNWRKAKAEHERALEKTRLLREGAVDSVTQEFILKCPIAGEIIAAAAYPGLEVQGQYAAGSNVVELFTIGELDKLWVIGDVYEMDLPLVAPGNSISVQVAAWPGRTFRGAVDWVSDTLDPVLRTAKMRAVIDNPDRVLKAEMAGSLRATVRTRRALAIPPQALLRVENETIVFVRTDSGFKRRKVEVGEERRSDMVVIRSGLAPGETIAVDRAILLLGILSK